MTKMKTGSSSSDSSDSSDSEDSENGDVHSVTFSVLFGKTLAVVSHHMFNLLFL